MKEVKEQLRKILCPDETIKDALGLLEKLVNAEKSGNQNWHSGYACGFTEEDQEVLQNLQNGGVINIGYFGMGASYCTTPKGKKIYNALKEPATQ